MRYRFIDAHKKVWPIYLMCKVFKVSRSGYYDWRSAHQGPRRCSNVVLDGQIREVFESTAAAMVRLASLMSSKTVV